MSIFDKLSNEQKEIVDSIVSFEKSKEDFIALPSIPGSGKTSTLLGGLEKYYSVVALKEETVLNNNGDMEYYFKNYTSDDIKEKFPLEKLYNPNQDNKICILNFSSSANADFIKRADKIFVKSICKEIEDDKIFYTEKEQKMSLLIDTSTYHSLLLRAAKPIIDKLGYIQDYSKSNFFKKDIDYINKKYELKLNQNEVKMYFKFIEEYHNSPAKFGKFCLEWNERYKDNILDNAQAKKIQTCINSLYKEMSNQNITMPHCFYYKLVHKYASENKDFLDSIFKDRTGKNYNFIIVDEAQDSDAIIYDLIKMSNKKSIFVGDIFQSIYGFRGAYPVLKELISNEKDKTQLLKLNKSFRYGKAISHLTSKMPEIFNHSSVDNCITAIGMQNEDYVCPTPIKIDSLKNFITNIITENANEGKKKKECSSEIAIICRSNKRALEIYSILKADSKIANEVKIESGLKSKTRDFISKGSSAIEDISLKEQIIGLLNKEEFNFEDMINNDNVCSLLAETEYAYLLKCKDENLKNIMLEKTGGYETVTIVTVHGSKGLEYNNVFVADDYIKESMNDIAIDFDDTSEIISNDDEKNIIYTAATRAKKNLFFLESKLFNILEKEIKVSSKYNSQILEEKNNYLLESKVYEITSKKEESKEVKSNNNINIEETNLFSMCK